MEHIDNLDWVSLLFILSQLCGEKANLDLANHIIEDETAHKSYEHSRQNQLGLPIYEIGLLERHQDYKGRYE